MLDTLKRLIVNLVVWLVFGLVLLGLNKLAPNLQQGDLAPVAALKRLIEPTLVVLQVIGVVLLLGALAILTFKFSDPGDGALAEILRLSTDEAGSILTNFASLMVVAGLVSKEGSSPFVVAAGIYTLAYLLLFRPRATMKATRWLASYPKIDNVEEEVSLNLSGQVASGTITPTKGPDVGRSYQVQGSFRDRMLVGFFESPSDGKRDKGAFALSLDNAGESYTGRVVYTHDSGELIYEQWVWRLQTSKA